MLEVLYKQKLRANENVETAVVGCSFLGPYYSEFLPVVNLLSGIKITQGH